jgi:hypothetical protein
MLQIQLSLELVDAEESASLGEIGLETKYSPRV